MKSVFPEVSKIYSTKFTTSSPLCPLFFQALRTSENLTSEHARCPTDICAKIPRNTVVGIDLKKCWTVVKPEMLNVKSGRSRDTIESVAMAITKSYFDGRQNLLGICSGQAENSFPRLTEDDRLEHLAPCFLDSRLSFVRQTTARALLEYCSPSHSCRLNANGSWGFPLKPLLFYPLSRKKEKEKKEKEKEKENVCEDVNEETQFE
uniref:Uncharacterized protein n=1 Tax=Vespula pensylvanica TaxID=30213 RepID=A0A834P3Z8_VESPE|nr:hypothetical protein H0235_007072 [Vespula pensylvanica]